MKRLLAFPASRRRKWVVLVLWLVFLGATAPLGARFEGAQDNDASSFLPGETDSVEALELSRQFRSGEQVPAIVVFRRADGLTAADRAAIGREREQLRAELPSFGKPPEPAVFSADGRAALLTVPLEPRGDFDGLADAVDGFRTGLAGAPAGLETKVGGPAGFAADVSKAFENVNGRLLISTALLVFVLLILIYRSPIFWFIPLLAIFAAEGAVRVVGYGLTQAGVTVNGQAGGILLVLVFGAGTDYALLLVSRYREELQHAEDRHEAMRTALGQAGPAILASAGTVVAGLACLALAKVNGTAGIGTIGAFGVAIAAVAMLTILPALLVVCGRWIFWPFVPRVGRSGGATRSLFGSVGERIARRPRRAWVGSTAALALMCLGLAGLDVGLTSAESFRSDVEAVQAQKLVGRSFPAGANAPTNVIVRDPARVADVRGALERTPGVATLGPVEEGPPGARFDVTLSEAPYSGAGFDLIPKLRDAVAEVDPAGATLVGGPTAEEHDVRVAAARDTLLLPPLVLVVVLLILIALLRSVVAPLLLVGTVILSFAATLGVSAIVFDRAFGFAGVDPSFPLIAFIFLVALGVDYNIFLMARVREEALAAGTRTGVLRGLSATGAVITSAGVVLAGTFAVLGVLPFVPLTQLGFTVAFGVLLDTLLVRSVLVPALVLDLEARTWWPSRLAADD